MVNLPCRRQVRRVRVVVGKRRCALPHGGAARRCPSGAIYLNILQLLGWGTFELLVIAEAAQAIFHGGPRWLYVLVTGALTTLLTLRPLGMLRLLRRYVTAVGWWSRLWTTVQGALGTVPAGWMSASLLSFIVAALVAYLMNLALGGRRHA